MEPTFLQIKVLQNGWVQLLVSGYDIRCLVYLHTIELVNFQSNRDWFRGDLKCVHVCAYTHMTTCISKWIHLHGAEGLSK